MKLKKLLFVALMTTALVLGTVAFACTKTPVAGPETGTYYYEAENDEYLLMLNNADNFILLYKNEIRTGKYKLKDGALNITMKDGDKEKLTAEYKDDAVVLTYDGATMRFLKKIFYTVTFETNGGSAVEEKTVINGKTVAQPVNNPEREGYFFWGWYADADFTTAFAFNSEPITGNRTVYARWIGYNAGETVYTATFNAGDGAEPVKKQTIGGKIYEAPVPQKDGYTFKGWWASATSNADELTYMLKDDTVLTENTTFYALWEENGASGNRLSAPLVNVTSGGVEIISVQGASGYRIQITGDGFDGFAAQGGETYYNISNILANAPAGDYVISVTALSPTSSDNDSEPSVRYYKHRALDKVSFFAVIEPSTLVFNSVDNAKNYYITVECGNKDHNHTMLNLGMATTFAFANCEMAEGGIKFQIVAEADGYASSVSDVFTYERKLDSVQGLEVDEATQTLTWKPVANAASYEVTVNGVAYDNGGKTSFDLKYFNKGKLEIAVKPVTDGYNSSATDVLTYNKQLLASPSGIAVDNTVLKWSGVEGATSYQINIGGKTYETDGAETEFDLAECGYDWLERQDYLITVIAIGEKSSLASDPINARYMVDVEYLEMLATLSYSNNTVTWNPVIGATAYEVQVNGGIVYNVKDGNAFCKVTLNKAGENVIRVRYLQDVFSSEWAEIKVFAYTVSFDGRGSAERPRDCYVANGDSITFTALTRAGYVFDGWYNAPGGAQGNAKEFKSEIFLGSGDVMLYAGWKPQQYSLKLNAGEDATVNPDEVKISYNQNYKLPVPVSTNQAVAFSGWYTEGGVKITDENGNSLKEWTVLGGGTATAQWLQIFQFKQQLDGTYSVTKGSGMSSVTTATVPAKYNGKLVTSVEIQAFSSCSKLVSFNIPDTILTLNSDSAFYGCKMLEEVNVYETGLTADPVYTSVDGVVFKLRDQSGSFFRVDYFPVAKTGKYTLPDGVTEIAKRVFYNSSITSITIPASVTDIEIEAFYYCKNLAKITFAAPKTGEAVKPLNIAKNAFKSCPLLTSVELPARLQSIATKTTESAFYLCNALTDITVAGGGANYGSVDGFLTNADKDTILYCPAGKSGDVEIPLGITAIDTYAFSGQTKIKTLKIPSYVTQLGTYAFSGCSELRRVTFSSSVLKNGTSVLANAFENCLKLTEIIFEDGSNVLEIGANAFKGCKALTSFTFPATLEKVGDSAFASCSNLREVNFSDSEKELALGKTVFSGCTSLVTINISANVSQIPVDIFSGCDSLENIFVDENNKTYADFDGVLYNKDFTVLIAYPKNKPAEEFKLADTLVEISAGAFKGNTKIKSVTISNKVSTIGANAFQDCTGITELIFETGNDENTLTAGSYAFSGLSRLASVVLPNRLQTISNYLFFKDSGLATVTMGSGVTSIGSFAFGTCSLLSSINFPDGLKTISASAFANTTNLKNITLNEGLETIGASAFTSSGLNTAFKIPDSVTSLGANAFEKTKITALTFGSGLTEIPDLVANGCTSITTVTISKNITKIGAGAFNGVTSLTTLKFEENEADGELSDEELKNLPGLVIADGTANITASTGATTVTKGAFKGCTKLTSVTLPARLTVLGIGAFGGCTTLTTVNFAQDGRLTEIGNGAFYNTKIGGTSGALVIPEGVITIGNGAFASCTSLKTVTLPTTLQDNDGKAAIGLGAFFKATSLTEVTVTPPVSEVTDGESTETETYPAFSIGDYAFNGCTNFTTLSVPAGLTGMLDSKTNAPRVGVFKDCTKFTNFNLIANGNEYASVDGVLYSSDKSEIIIIPVGKTGTLTIPATVSIIKAGTFTNSKFSTIIFAEADKENDEQEVSLEIEDGTITTGAFANMVNLSSVTLPERTTKIGHYAFYKSGTAATKLTVTINEGVEDGEPKGVTEIGNSVFNGCTKLASFNIPASVTTIGNGMFAGCIGLNTLTFTSGGTEELTIADGTATSSAFVSGSSASKALTGTLTLPARLTNMPNYMFYYCGMSDVQFEEVEQEDGSKAMQCNVKKLGNHVYYYCTELTEIIIHESVEEIDTGNPLCYASTKVGKLTVNSSKVSVDNMENVINRLVRNTLSATYGTALKEVSVPESNTLYKSVDGVLYSKDAEGNLDKLLLVPYKKDFTAVSGVKSFVIPDGVKEIGLGAFFYQQNLTSVTIPKTVTKIDKIAFYKTKLTQIIFEEGNEGEELQNLVIDSGTTTSTMAYNTSATSFGGVFGEMTALANITLPARLTYIGYGAFANSAKLAEINFAANSRINEISHYVFYKTIITEFTVPASLTIFGEHVFNQCTKLETIRFEENSQLKELGTMPFTGCNALTNIYNLPTTGLIFIGRPFQGASAIKSVAIPYGNTAIEDYAFYQCTALESIIIPNSVTSIGKLSFSQCTSLKSIDIPDSVTSIGESAFQKCTSLETVNIPDSVSTIAKSAFAGCSALESIKIPDGVTEIAENLFGNGGTTAAPVYCTLLKTVEMGESITLIGKNAFLNCTSLKSIDIPASVSSIGEAAFSGCTSLAEVNMEGAGAIGKSAFMNCTSLKELNFPANTTAIGETAFSGCVLLQSADLSKTSVEAISKQAFLNCSSVTELSIGSATKEIGQEAFKGCSALKDLSISNGLETIGNSAFQGCLLLAEVILPWSLQSLGTDVFADCNFLESVEVMAGNETYASIDGVLFDKKYTQLILYPVNRSGELRIPNTVTSLAAGVFKGTPITEIALPNTVTTLAESSFEGCKNLTSITLPSNLTSIGDRAFYGCKNLSVINIPATVNSIGKNAFEGCGKLAVLNIGTPDPNKSSEGLVTIGNYAFNGTKITNLRLPDTVKTIGDCAFMACPITEITLSKELTSIGSGAFEGTKISNLVIPATLTALGSRAFYGCTSLQTVEFAEGRTSELKFNNSSVSVGGTPGNPNDPPTIVTTGHFFADCINLKTVILDAGIAAYGINAFAGCINLQNVSFRGNAFSSAISTGSSMFEGCTKLSEITLPEFFTNVYTNTFKDCINLSRVEFEGAPLSMIINVGAFYNCVSLKTITLPESTVTLGSSMGDTALGAFEGSGLTSLSIPSGVTYIGVATFRNCKSLTSFEIPNSILQIYGEAFAGSGLTEISVPAGVTTVSAGAFKDCKSLRKAELPNTVESVSASLFQNCTLLESVILPDRWSASNQTSQYIFWGCANLKKVRLQTSKANDENGNDPSIGDIEFASGIAILNTGLFDGCSSLQTVIIPEGVTKLNSCVFRNCVSLNKMVLPVSLSEMSNTYYSTGDSNTNAFSGTPLDIMDITFKAGEDGAGFKLEDGVLYGDKKVADGIITYTTVYAVSGNKTGSYKTPEGVTTIKEYSFTDSKITSVTLGADVTEVQGYAFKGSAIETFALEDPDSVTKFSSGGIFQNCTNLYSVQLPTNSSVSSIPTDTFAGCTSLKSIDLSNNSNIKTIGNRAFAGSGLVSFNFTEYIGSDTGTTVGTSAFANCKDLSSVTFDGGTAAISLGDYAFQGCTALNEIAFPSRLSNTGSGNGLNTGCFEGCTSLGKVTFATTWNSGKSRPSILASVFRNCTSLTSIVLPDYMGSVGANCFEGCTALASVTFGNWDGTGFSINASAFKDCASLKSITLPDKLSAITAGVFENSGLTSVTLPESITAVGASAFKGCTDLTSVTAKGVVTLNASAFKGCENLSELELGNVTAIGESAFEGCSSLTELAFTSASLTAIGAAAFKDCTNLETLTLGANVTAIGESAFENCSSLTALDIKSVTSIGVSAFAGCSSLTSVTITYSILAMDAGVFENWTQAQTINVVGLNKAPMNWEDGWSGNATVVWNYTGE